MIDPRLQKGKEPSTTSLTQELTSPELVMLRNNKQHGYNYRERKYGDWTENYEFYRDKVSYNRLTQRQSVNLPLMKKSIKTYLRYIDTMPIIEFQALDNNEQAEIFKNEYWKHIVEINRMELQDVIDKKQVLLFGRSFAQWQIIDGKVVMTVQDPEDILVSRYTEPHNLHSSRFLIHTHIFAPLSSLDKNTGYDKDAIARLKQWHADKMGLIKSTTNLDMLTQRQEKLQSMGVTDAVTPILGETYVEVSLHFVFRDEFTEGETKYPPQIWLYVEVDDMEILMKKPLEEVIGVTKDHFWRNHFPYDTWADDIERQDFWSDSVADILRQPNKVINSWYSQLVENRTMRNFSMHYYNSSMEGFVPQSYQPIAWGWYGIPVPTGKNISDVIQNVEIPNLDSSQDDIEFVVGIVNEATGTSNLLQGTPLPGRIQLGVAEMVAQESQQRIKDTAKFYNQVWKDRGEIFVKLLEAAGDKIDAVKIYTKGRNSDDLYEREIGPKDWKNESGYICKVWTQEDRNNQNSQSIQKIQLARADMPTNAKLKEIHDRKLLEFAGLPADDIKAIMDLEERNAAIMAGQPIVEGQNPIQTAPPPAPDNGQALEKLENIRSKIV